VIGLFILLGTIAAFAVTVTVLDGIDYRRQQRERK
jgi:hypothetical protein